MSHFLSVRLSICLFVRLSICPSVRLSVSHTSVKLQFPAMQGPSFNRSGFQTQPGPLCEHFQPFSWVHHDHPPSDGLDRQGQTKCGWIAFGQCEALPLMEVAFKHSLDLPGNISNHFHGCTMTTHPLMARTDMDRQNVVGLHSANARPFL